ncbi:MAG: OadG family protein [Treponema sp.]|nr:OadG family protein [Treponema sp.]
MTIFDMLRQSGVLSLLGMGIVFSFLVILVICVSIMGSIMRRFGASKDEADGGIPPNANKKAVTAAISAAVNSYHKDNS